MSPSPAETVLLDFLRDPALPELLISIARTADAVVVTMAIPGDGVNIGAGPTFEAAFFDLCGRDLPVGSLLAEPATPQQH